MAQEAIAERNNLPPVIWNKFQKKKKNTFRTNKEMKNMKRVRKYGYLFIYN